jgi:hypothetical protein
MDEIQTPEWAIVKGLKKSDYRKKRIEIAELIDDMPLDWQRPDIVKLRYVQRLLIFGDDKIDAEDLRLTYKVIDDYFQEEKK